MTIVIQKETVTLMMNRETTGSSDASEPRWLKAAFAVNIVAFAVAILLIQLDPLQPQANRGYFDSPASELGPDARPFLPISTLDEAVEIANARLPGIVGEAYVPFARGNEYFWGELIWDHDWGNIYYWELSQDDCSVSIDATTGEVVCFDSNEGWKNGTLTKEGALTLGMMYLQMFGELPEDATTPTVESTDGHSYETYDYSTDTFSKTYRPVWVVYFERIKDGIPTDDHIVVSLDPSGHLDGYRKVWSMHLGGITAGRLVSRDEALEIARSASGGLNVTSIEHRIVRPMGGWPDGPFIYGTEPVCVWRVTFEHNHSTYLAEMDIDDTTGEIVGADEYC